MNRNRIKKIAFHLTSPISFGALQRFSNENFIFPFYHLVAKETPEYIRHLYKAPTPEQFVADLEFLLKFYKPASLDDIKEYVSSGKKLHKPSFFLSFDDGLKECYEVIYPILKEKGIQAAFFINPAFVDNQEIFYRLKTSLIIERLLNISDSKIINDLAIRLNIRGNRKELLVKEILNISFEDSEKLEECANFPGRNKLISLKKAFSSYTKTLIKNTIPLHFRIPMTAFHLLFLSTWERVKKWISPLVQQG